MGPLPDRLQRVGRQASEPNFPGPRRNQGGCLRSIAGLIGLLILAGAGLAGFDMLVAPWAWGGVLGRPSLTGEWVGSFSLPGGQSGAAYLNLTHNPNEDFGGSRLFPSLPPLGGTALGCFRGAGAQAYSLSGGAAANGQDVELTFRAQKPTVPAYALHFLKGAWDGNALSLSGTFTRILDTQGSTIVESEPNQTRPTTVVFHRGGRIDFDRACQTLGPSR